MKTVSIEPLGTVGTSRGEPLVALLVDVFATPLAEEQFPMQVLGGVSSTTRRSRFTASTDTLCCYRLCINRLEGGGCWIRRERTVMICYDIVCLDMMGPKLLQYGTCSS